MSTPPDGRCDPAHQRRQAGQEPAGHRNPGDAPEGDDMTTSARAAVNDEGLPATVRGEAAGARAAIIIVGPEAGAREILHRELSKRYGADYQILACGRPAELAPWMR